MLLKTKAILDESHDVIDTHRLSFVEENPTWTPAFAGVTTTGIRIPMGGPQAHGALGMTDPKVVPVTA